MKKEFETKAQDLTIVVGGKTIVAEVKKFKTGSVGWYANPKIKLTLPDGTTVQASVGLNLIVIDSKEKQGDDELGVPPASDSSSSSETAKPKLAV